MQWCAAVQAGTVVLCEPEVRRVALPNKGGRLIIASDGLWDAVNPKTAAHHVRGMQASKAATELVRPQLLHQSLSAQLATLDERCDHLLGVIQIDTC